jgi:hypothetical protein
MHLNLRETRHSENGHFTPFTNDKARKILELGLKILAFASGMAFANQG